MAEHNCTEIMLESSNYIYIIKPANANWESMQLVIHAIVKAHFNALILMDKILVYRIAWPACCWKCSCSSKEIAIGLLEYIILSNIANICGNNALWTKF